VPPLEDQWQYDRAGLLYFAKPNNDPVLIPIGNSLVLKAAGVKTRFEQPLTMEQWVRRSRHCS
jgi:hypothetical protein